MKAIGLDIGTTSICGILMDAGSGKLQKKETLSNDAGLKGGEDFERLQDPKRILELCQKLLKELMEEEEEIAGIGVTGQMHGILYLNPEGEAVSPLMTWQDQRGNQPHSPGRTYAEALSGFGPYRLATGFGAVTHFYNTINGKIPKGASCFCTIPDYVALSLAGKKQPLLHASMAASLGMFDLKKREFDREQIEQAGMEASFFPKIAKTEQIFGFYQENIPVSLAFGDNQASFLGAVEKGSRVLVNVGTGSQVSVLGGGPREFTALECRPYLGESCLYVGSSLCGGSAYALLKNFFEETWKMCGGLEPGDGELKSQTLYERMEQAGREAKERAWQKDARLSVDTRFLGTREQPWVRGSMTGISMDNLTPGALVLGVLEGICQELLGYYKQMELPGDWEEASDFLTGSGNGIRQNSLLQELFCEYFHKPMRLSPYAEEAAYGSARFLLHCLEGRP